MTTTRLLLCDQPESSTVDPLIIRLVAELSYEVATLPATDDPRARDLDALLDRIDLLLVIVRADWTAAVQSDERISRVVAEAVRRRLPVVPVLIDGAALPPTTDLPTELRTLTEGPAISLTGERFEPELVVLRAMIDWQVAQSARDRAGEVVVVDAAELPEPERALDENVQFTVYRPKAIQPAQWYDLLAFAHLADRRPDAPADEPDPLEQVKAQAERLLGRDLANYDDPRSDSRFGVPRDGEITFLPQVPGVEFNPERRVFRWREDVHREEFRIRADPELAGRTVRGRLSVYLGVVILAEVDLAIRVDGGAPRPGAGPAVEPTADHARPYRKIFASYSHRDEEVVRQFERLASSLGDEYLRDVIRLRAGADWDEALLDLINEADVFQLFWSSNSMTSPHVRREWEHALTLGRPYFVRPTYWEVPLPTSQQPQLPPDSLRRLHFQQISNAESAAGSPIPTPHGGLAAPIPAPQPISAPGPAAIPAAAPPPPAKSPRGPRRWLGFIVPAAVLVVGAPLALSVINQASQGPGATAPAPTSIASRSPAATTTTSPGNATRQLLAQIPDDITERCRPWQPEGGDLTVGLAAAVRCPLTGAGRPDTVWYLSYRTEAAAGSVYESATGDTYRDGNCRAAGQTFDFTTTDGPGKAGNLRCFKLQDVSALAWMNESLRVVAFAEDPDLSFAKLTSWWKKAGPYRTPGPNSSSEPV